MTNDEPTKNAAPVKYILNAPVTSHDARLRSAVAYLQIYNAWRESRIASGVLCFEPEPAKLTDALDTVTRHCLDGLNTRWAAGKADPLT
jgi:hypothetical protein